MSDYDEMMNRNAPLIPSAVQGRVRSIRLLICGLGMGSVIAELAVRTGFCNFILIDNDVVSISNLNRQIFVHADLGALKVDAAAKRITEINPKSRVCVAHRYFDPMSDRHMVENSDIIIDAIDISSLGAITGLHQLARAYDKPVFSPFNLGTLSALMVFDKDSVSIKSLLEIERLDYEAISSMGFEQIMYHWLSLYRRYEEMLPVESAKFMREYALDIATKGWCPLPQLGITTLSTASLVISVLLQYISNRNRVKKAPHIYRSDITSVRGLRIIRPRKMSVPQQ